MKVKIKNIPGNSRATHDGHDDTFVYIMAEHIGEVAEAKPSEKFNNWYELDVDTYNDFLFSKDWLEFIDDNDKEKKDTYYVIDELDSEVKHFDSKEELESWLSGLIVDFDNLKGITVVKGHKVEINRNITVSE
jgi:hypothetical protein